MSYIVNGKILMKMLVTHKLLNIFAGFGNCLIFQSRLTNNLIHRSFNMEVKAYLEITMKIDSAKHAAAAQIYSDYRKPFLNTIKGALTKQLLVRDEDVQVLHGFDSAENASAYLESSLFTQHVAKGLSQVFKFGEHLDTFYGRGDGSDYMKAELRSSGIRQSHAKFSILRSCSGLADRFRGYRLFPRKTKPGDC